ncbi:hypothetical protein PIB30_012264 [Stylosanthes scabra]|uniref:Uncharacterized protein n=1 Tax=Stylosanthes scabra TaxID=79078 RepID=A0ABU6W5I5_9FABA|nr:hypothetical protein [Stylosanthes scabra]
MRTPIKHYDKLYFLYGQDRATGKIAASAKERNKCMENRKETIDLNDVDDFNDLEVDSNDGRDTPHSTSYIPGFCKEFGNSNKSIGTQGTSRGTKRKTQANDSLDADLERMSKGIKVVADTLKDGNNYYDRSLEIAEKQALTAERQAETAEKQLALVERQVMIAEEQVQVAKIQAQTVERGITFLEQSRTRVYSENDVYVELKKLGIVGDIFRSCYRFLCRDERAKRELFGVPFEDRHTTLYDLMKEADAI